MRYLRVLFFVMLAAAGAQAFARATVPIVDHENVAVATASGRAPTAADVAHAIRQAAASMQWEVSDAGPDRMLARLVVRGKHTIATEIRYSAQSFSVKYQSSVNMNYGSSESGVPSIHPNYNRWVQSFVDAIRARVSAL